MDYLSLPNGRFAYVRQGRGSPVLLLHGLGSSLLDWQPQIEHLAQHCEVFALDVRGHGQSEPLRAPVSMAELAADVADFIRAMDIAPCTLVGISMGGMLTFQLLADQPALVRAAVVVNSAPSFPLDSWKIRAQVWLRLGLVRLLGLPALETQVIVLLASIGQGANVFLMARQFRAVEGGMAGALIISTAASAITTPLLLALTSSGRI